MSLASAYVHCAEPHNLWITLELPDSPLSSVTSCPHCQSRRVQRWGRFGGRQRFRCRDCARTYTDLTGTPLAQLKHRDRWAALGVCLIEGLSVRASAQVLNVSSKTAFRWRHRFLDALRVHEKPRLTGVPELTVRNLVSYRLRLMTWAKPFRGVSAKYYRNYLAWFSFVDERRGVRPVAALDSLLSKILPGLALNFRSLSPLLEARTRPLPSWEAWASGGLVMLTNIRWEQTLRAGRRVDAGAAEAEEGEEAEGPALAAPSAQSNSNSMPRSGACCCAP